MSQSKTAMQIQKAAETLFAEQGFAETTMRQITASADVNLAAVNYHFGSKQGLIQAVAETYLRPFSEYIDDAIKERSRAKPSSISLNELIETLMRALLHVHEDNTHALSMFSRLLDMAYMKNQDVLREYLFSAYRNKIEPFIQLLREDASPMEDDEFFWRLHFLLGSMIFTLSNYHTLASLELKEYEKNAEIELILHRMTPVLSAGFQARSEQTYFCRL